LIAIPIFKIAIFQRNFHVLLRSEGKLFIHNLKRVYVSRLPFHLIIRVSRLRVHRAQLDHKKILQIGSCTFPIK